MPLMIRRSSTRSLPRTSVGKYGSIRTHCSSLSQNRLLRIFRAPGPHGIIKRFYHQQLYWVLTLVTLLRPILSLYGITVKPEGHMAADKRADISVAMPGRKVLCELKCEYHPDVWTAADQQLDRFYAHDPEAKGFGVYVVIWFGDKRTKPIATH